MPAFCKAEYLAMLARAHVHNCMYQGNQGGRTVRCARAMRKVGHSPPPVGSFFGVGLPQGTIAIVYPCSINPPPSCVYVPFAAALRSFLFLCDVYCV